MGWLRLYLLFSERELDKQQSSVGDVAPSLLPCSLSERAVNVSFLTMSEPTGRARSPEEFLTVRN